MSEDAIFALIPILGISIPIFGILLTGFRRWADLKEKQLAATAQLSAEQAAQYASKIATLEERVAVLNRIVTDRNEGLTAQIESLRDTPPATDKIN
jgi:type II secretory pathway pseudopilin PulG